MRYLSLFSGIGGFEYAIHKIYPRSVCLGYSEIKPEAIAVYKHHYPNHKNLGDITKINDVMLDDIIRKKCELIVGGFPCTNLTSVSHIARNGNSEGLLGPESGLFVYMLYIIKYILDRRKHKCHFIIENNASMSKSNRELITDILESSLDTKIYMCALDAATFGVQTRKRLFWTSFGVDLLRLPKKPLQTFKDLLEPLGTAQKYVCSDKVIKNTFNKIYTCKNSTSVVKNVLTVHKCKNNLWAFKQQKMRGKYSKWSQMALHSDTVRHNKIQEYKYPVGKMRTICGIRTILLDRRSSLSGNEFMIRCLTNFELERAFFFPDGYVSYVLKSKNKIHQVLANSVSTKCIEFILLNLR